MRSDQTAQFVAARPYRDARERNRSIYEHNRRVLQARRDRAAGDAGLARQALLTVSGQTVMSAELSECCRCRHLVGATYRANSITHRIVNRSGNPVKPERCALCVRCWSELLRDADDPDDAPVVTVRWC